MIDTGSTAFMILCTSLVMLMTPGLAFFYGGLSGRRNILGIMMISDREIKVFKTSTKTGEGIMEVLGLN